MTLKKIEKFCSNINGDEIFSKNYTVALVKFTFSKIFFLIIGRNSVTLALTFDAEILILNKKLITYLAFKFLATLLKSFIDFQTYLQRN